MAALQIPRLAVAQSGLKHMDRISIPAMPNENTINTLHLFSAGQNENCCRSSAVVDTLTILLDTIKLI